MSNVNGWLPSAAFNMMRQSQESSKTEQKENLDETEIDNTLNVSKGKRSLSLVGLLIITLPITVFGIILIGIFTH